MTLRQVLLTGLEDVVHFDKEFTRYEQHPDGTVTAFFEDGSTATGDLLVGRRRRRLAGPPAVPARRPGWRTPASSPIAGKLPLTAESAALLPPRVFEGISMVMAPKGYCCILHVMEFKWDRAGGSSRASAATTPS